MQVNLSIKGVPVDTAERLRQRAARNHRSLQGELMAIIEQAAAEPEAGTPAGAAAPMHGGHRGRTEPAPLGWKTIEDLIAERHSRARRHHDGLPLAVDIIRADRDSR